MSEENADTIRRAYEVWNESGPAAVTDQFWAEDAVYREGSGWPNAGTQRALPGHASHIRHPRQEEVQEAQEAPLGRVSLEEEVQKEEAPLERELPGNPDRNLRLSPQRRPWAAPAGRPGGLSSRHFCAGTLPPVRRPCDSLRGPQGTEVGRGSYS